MNFNYVITVLLLFWVSGLSLFLFWAYRISRKLLKNVKGESLLVVLDKIINREEKNRQDITSLAEEIKRVDNQGTAHVQKIGLIRFNPFPDTGGNSSFSLSMLNGRNSGFVMTALHARDRTRIYVKSVKRGKSTSELSLEEKKAISESLKIK